MIILQIDFFLLLLNYSIQNGERDSGTSKVLQITHSFPIPEFDYNQPVQFAYVMTVSTLLFKQLISFAENV